MDIILRCGRLHLIYLTPFRKLCESSSGFFLALTIPGEPLAKSKKTIILI